jgi:L,D-transpeptidase ErfK/SrfK
MYLSIGAAVLFMGQIIGSESVYTVRAGDSLTTVGARFGVSARVLAEANDVVPTSHLSVGHVLEIDNRHLTPSLDGARIVVNIPQRMLFWVSTENEVQAFPIAAGKRTWKTPIGDFGVATRETDPTWDVPLTIQEEMRREGRPVLTHVPPSPQNPLGKYWLGLTIPGVGIHGTNAPASIYSLVTHGCIRLHPDDIAQLFSQVEIGTRGRIVYEPVLIARVGDRLFLEVHPDAYGTGPEPLGKVLEQARSGGYADMLDLPLVKETIRKRDGIARDVTRR